MNLIKATYEKGVVTLSDGKKIPCPAEVKKAHDDFYKAEVERLQKAIAEMEKDPNAKPEEVQKLHANLEKDQTALLAAHPVVYGIRPEDIHEADKGDYKLKVAVAELLGHEYYVHSDFAGIDLVAKIPLTHEIKLGDTISVSFEESKAHIFDPESEKRIY
jgi:ABC-type sugar transport system ATPase subunit